MKKAEISMLARHSRRQNGQDTPPITTNCIPLNDKTQSKFSRKPETHVVEPKRQSCKQIDTQMRYISPSRTSFSQALLPSCPPSLSFQQISHKFALNGNELNLPLCSTVEQTKGRKKQREPVGQRTSVPQKIEAKGSIAWAKEDNLVWKRESKHLQSMNDVLAEEQRFNHILRENTRLINELSLKSKQNEDLLHEVGGLRKEIAQLKQQIDTQTQAQKLAIQKALKADQSLNIKSLQEKVFHPSHKENSPHARQHLVARPKLKCNNSFQFPNQVLDHDCSKTKPSDPLFAFIKQLFPNKSTSLVHGRSQTPEEPHSRQQLTKLKEKLRYCEIEIDILRRTRMSNDQHVTDNQKLRRTNRRLMQRLSFLRQTPLRRSRVHSDSTLSLSLSPTRF